MNDICDTCSRLQKDGDLPLPEENRLFLDLNILTSNKTCKARKVDKKETKEKRKTFVAQLKKSVCAIRNSGGGTVFIHLEGKADKDRCLDYFNELVDVPLNAIIEDGDLFVNTYKKGWLEDYCDEDESPESKSELCDFIYLTVAGSKTVSTDDFMTKVPLDNAIHDPLCSTIRKHLTAKIISSPKPAKIRGLKNGINEKRNIQVKVFYFDDDNPTPVTADQCSSYLWNNCKLAYYISAFTKIDEGGSFYLGIGEKEKEYQTEGYISKTFDIEGFQLINESAEDEIREKLKQDIVRQTTICSYQGSQRETQNNLIKLAFHPVQGKEKFVVLEVAVAAVEGLLFHDIEGPQSYELNAEGYLKRIPVEDWYNRLFPTEIDKLDSLAVPTET